MLPDVQHLMELQQADREILRLNQEVAALPKRVAAIEEKLAGTKAVLEKAKAAVKADEATKRKYESAIQDQQGKISKYRDQSLAVKTNEQYKALLHEIQFAEQDIKSNEDRILELMLNGDARALLTSAVRFKLDERVRDRIIAETRGNPLALLELPRGLTAKQLAGGFGLVEAQGLAGRIEESFVRRFETLSDDARRLLLIAAAEPVGDPLLLLAASERLGIALSTTDTETDSLLALGQRVTFRHPLVRSAVYRTATREQRREVHLALAEATDRSVDPDRRAWHLATAAAGPAVHRRAAAWPRQPRSCIALSFCRATPNSGCGVRLLLPKRACMPACSRTRSSFWRWPRPRRQTSCRRRTWSCSGVRSRSRRAWGPLRRHCS